MSALSTLGNVMSQKTGLPPQAASAPGDASGTSGLGQQKFAVPQSNPLVAVANAVGKPVPANSPGFLPAAPTAQANPNDPGIAAKLVGFATHKDPNDPTVQQAVTNNQVAYYQSQIDQGTAAKQKADADVATYQTQYNKAQANIGQLKSQTSDDPNGDYEVAATGLPNGYSIQSGDAPQVLVSNYNIGDHVSATVYTLQPDGTYAAQQVSGVKIDTFYSQYLHGKTAVWVDNPRALQDFQDLGRSAMGLKNAQAASANADTQVATAKSNLTTAQAKLNNITGTIAQNKNVQALGQSLGAIGGGFNSAYQTDVDQANQQKTAYEQQAGLGTIGNAGAVANANAFGTANISQTNNQGLAVQKAGLVDQQAQQVGTALQSALQQASAQTGLQLQTMQQDLSTAIQALQNDLQYASGEQQLAIQNYINALQNQQAQLQNRIGGGAVTDSEITAIGTGIASGVASATATYAASAKKGAT